MTTYASYYLLSPATQIYHREPSTSTPAAATTTPDPSRASSSFSSTTPLTAQAEKTPIQSSRPPSADERTSHAEPRSKSRKWYDLLRTA